MTYIADSDAMPGGGSPAAGIAVSDAMVSDYIALLKPRVMSLVIFTALVGMVMAPNHIHAALAVIALAMIAIGAGASGALNMWFESDIDALMTRTRGRPLPRGAITHDEALTFGIMLSAGSVLVLGLVANWLAAALLAFTIFFYAVVYTQWLKRTTPLNIVIGGAAGAMPPVVAWAAMTGDLSLPPVILFLIIFLWTPPHFWALALYKSDDYARAGVPMLPVVAGSDETRRQIVVYTALYLPATLLPVICGFAGLLYGGIATLLALCFGVAAWRVYRLRQGGKAEQAARQLFALSILHLFLLFVLLLVEHISGMSPLMAPLAGWMAG